MKSLNFRRDINGLRAIAVLSVMIFHLYPSVLPGGFTGVDIFFVISGYLMTAIIFGKVEAGTFSLSGFYLARFRRIVPALAFLCSFLLIVGWFSFTPSDYTQLGKHAASSVGFLSNITYWLEVGYFDAAAREKWLLHTWSLSVEWQFYILYPLAVLIILKFFSYETVRKIFVFGIFLGFVFSVLLSFKRPEMAFYLLPARGWELLIGGVAYLYTVDLPDRSRSIIFWLGMILIVVGFFILSEGDIWPGYLALLPVLGTLVILIANKQDAILLNNAFSQWIGRISYSVYLWHWPIVVAINYMGQSNNIYFIAVGAVLSVFMGHVSYELIETKGRALTFFNIKGIHYSNPVILGIFALSLGVLVFLNDGYKQRTDERFNVFVSDQVMPTRDNGYCFYSFDADTTLTVSENGHTCSLGDKDLPSKGLFFGDSFAGQYDPFWEKIAISNNISINSVSTNWCSPSFEDSFYFLTNNPAYQQCLLNRKYLKENIGDYEFLILATSWVSVFKSDLQGEVYDVIEFAAENDVDVIVMPSPTHYDTNVLKRFQMAFFNDIDFSLEGIPKQSDQLVSQINSELKSYAQKNDRVFFIERHSLFSSSDSYVKDGVNIPFSFDGSHITLEGAIKAAENFKDSDQYDLVVDIITKND